MKLINTFIFSNRLGIRISRHLLFWTTDIVSYLIVVGGNVPIDGVQLAQVFLKIPLVALAAYFILYYLIPEFSKKNDARKLWGWIILIFFYLGVGLRVYKNYVINPITGIDQPDFHVWDASKIVLEIFNGMVIISLAIVIKLIKNKLELEQSNQQLIAEKRAAELNFLKAQMQPHFLFNTLNTLYSETIQESGKAQKVVLYLSGLLRFMLEECNKPLIPIGHEIKVVKDFIALEQLRHGDRLTVTISIENINPDILISPLIFLPFVENSFKHTLATKRGNIKIDVAITMKENNISMVVENDKAIVEKHVNGHRQGQGISNIKRQLELLYGTNYSLNVVDGTDKFRVSLLVPSQSAEHA